MTSIEDAVRAWAKGVYPTEAGVELLIRQGKAVYEGAPWIEELEPLGDDRPRMARIHVDKLLYESGVWSGGERRVVRIAASLFGGGPIELSEALPGLDRENLALVLAAVAHAGGSHEHHPSPFIDNPDGTATLNPDRGDVLPSLFPWPDEG